MLKKKADQHTQRCYGAYFTCIDCSTTFNGADYRKHTQCITEDQKYQKALYRPKKQQQPKQQQQPKEQPKEQPEKESKPVETKKTEKKSKVEKPKFDLGKHKGEKLYKVLKKLSKDDKKALLKKIQITKEGNLELA